MSAAANGDPPAASTPTIANWDAPVKTRSDRAHVCSTSRPEETPTAPNDTPYVPVATPTARLSRTIARSWRFTGATRSDEGGVEPDLLDAGGAGAVQVQLAVGGVDPPAGTGEEPPARVVGGDGPRDGTV